MHNDVSVAVVLIVNEVTLQLATCCMVAIDSVWPQYSSVCAVSTMPSPGFYIVSYLF